MFRVGLIDMIKRKIVLKIDDLTPEEFAEYFYSSPSEWQATALAAIGESFGKDNKVSEVNFNMLSQKMPSHKKSIWFIKKLNEYFGD
jgi:hypothetical protein